MISNIGIMSAFLAGIVSFLSPCVLPLVPGYVSYISGNTLVQGEVAVRSARSTLLLSGCFVLGFSTIFVMFGASATALGQLLLSFRYEATITGGVIVILFGVFMTGLVRMPWLEQDLRFHGDVRAGRPTGAYLLGMAFGFGWTPCIGPVLGAILTASALSATVTSGIVLLAVYSLGLGVPFLLSAAFGWAGATPEDDAPCGAHPAGHCRCGDDRHGHRHDHRPPVPVLVLAARELPPAGPDRLKGPGNARQARTTALLALRPARSWDQESSVLIASGCVGSSGKDVS